MTAIADQRDQALARANEIRLHRAAERRRVHALPTADGLSAVAQILADNPEWVRTANLGDVLTWPRRVGARARDRVLTRTGMSPSKSVGTLTARQRLVLGVALVGTAEPDSGPENAPHDP